MSGTTSKGPFHVIEQAHAVAHRRNSSFKISKPISSFAGIPTISLTKHLTPPLRKVYPSRRSCGVILKA
jgi:hypothetical protein